MPSAPWHIVQFSASVAPRPTASPGARTTHGGSSTTAVDSGPLFESGGALPHDRRKSGRAADACPYALRR